MLTGWLGGTATALVPECALRGGAGDEAGASKHTAADIPWQRWSKLRSVHSRARIWQLLPRGCRDTRACPAAPSAGPGTMTPRVPRRRCVACQVFDSAGSDVCPPAHDRWTRPRARRRPWRGATPCPTSAPRGLLALLATLSWAKLGVDEYDLPYRVSPSFRTEIARVSIRRGSEFQNQYALQVLLWRACVRAQSRG